MAAKLTVPALGQGGMSMSWPEEYEERIRVNGFSVLDDDFDLMLGDLCCEPREETNLDKIRRLLGINRTILSRSDGTPVPSLGAAKLAFR